MASFISEKNNIVKCPPKSGLGQYCIKARAHIVQKSTSERLKSFTGYSRDYGIVEKTKKICQAHACSNTKIEDVQVIIQRFCPNCDGRIEVLDLKSGDFRIIR